MKKNQKRKLNGKVETIDDLKPDPQNARRHGPRNLSAITSSLNSVGAARSIVIDEKNTILAGNGLVESARETKIRKVRVVEADGNEIIAVRRSGLSPKQKAILAIADNRTAELAGWDTEQLLKTIEEFKLDLPEIQFSEEELREMSFDPESAEEDEIPSKVEARCKAGDLWALGGHRLLCGDSTKAEDVNRLLAGAVPFIMVTDPPYGVEYDPEWREQYDQFERHSTGRVQNDNRIDWTETYNLFSGDVAYVWHAGVYAGPLAVNLGAAKFEIRTQIIWVKQHFVFGRGSYHWQHEPCWYAVRKGKASKWCGDRTQSTTWDIANKNPMGGKQDDENTQHGTQKPVECMARPIRNHGTREDDVYDPFCGSGTTIIAAEQLDRRCYAMEISPAYCDVILARWEKLTGKTAKLTSGASSGERRALAQVPRESDS